MSEKKEPLKLSPALDNKFKLAPGHHAGTYAFRGTEYDLTNISAEKAAELVEAGFDILQAVKGAETKKP